MVDHGLAAPALPLRPGLRPRRAARPSGCAPHARHQPGRHRGRLLGKDVDDTGWRGQGGWEGGRQVGRPDWSRTRKAASPAAPPEACWRCSACERQPAPAAKVPQPPAHPSAGCRRSAAAGRWPPGGGGVGCGREGYVAEVQPCTWPGLFGGARPIGQVAGQGLLQCRAASRAATSGTSRCMHCPPHTHHAGRQQVHAHGAAAALGRQAGAQLAQPGLGGAVRRVAGGGAAAAAGARQGHKGVPEGSGGRWAAWACQERSPAAPEHSAPKLAARRPAPSPASPTPHLPAPSTRNTLPPPGCSSMRATAARAHSSAPARSQPAMAASSAAGVAAAGALALALRAALQTIMSWWGGGRAGEVGAWVGVGGCMGTNGGMASGCAGPHAACSPAFPRQPAGQPAGSIAADQPGPPHRRPQPHSRSVPAPRQPGPPGGPPRPAATRRRRSPPRGSPGTPAWSGVGAVRLQSIH